MSAVERFAWASPEYAEAFAALLRCSGERSHLQRFLHALTASYPPDALAVEWGAGVGDLTGLLLERFRRVLAIEPSPALHCILSRRYPRAEILDGTLSTAELPDQVDLGLISHVFYHLPDHAWAAATIRAARWLTERGVLAVILKDCDSACNRMLEHFGARRFDLVGALVAAIHHHGAEFDFTFTRLPGGVRTGSYDETLAIARFMLCDRAAEAFSAPPSEEQFRDYVRRHFWDGTSGAGGWDYDLVICLVRPNRWYRPPGT
jgi:hypothetical protein